MNYKIHLTSGIEFTVSDINPDVGIAGLFWYLGINNQNVVDCITQEGEKPVFLCQK